MKSSWTLAATLFSKSAHWRAMIPLLLLVAGMAAQGLNHDLIWYDELTSISHAGGVDGPFSPLEVADSVREHSPKHTPLFFELVAGWAALVGWHHAALRWMPLCFGLLALAWVYRVGAEFIGQSTGTWAAAFLGFNVYWLDYLHEIRMYSLQFALIMALAWHYFFIVRESSQPRRHHWLGFILSAALCLYAQPFTIFFHLALGAHHYLLVRRSKRWYQVALAMFAAGALYLPWLPVTLHGLTAKFDTAFDAITLEQAVEIFVRLLSNGNPLILLILLVAALMQLRRQDERRRCLRFWLMSISALVILLAANEAVGLIPLRRSRYFFVTWGMWALVLGSGLAWFKWRWLAPLVLAVYLASGFALRSEDDYLLYQGTVGVVYVYPPMGEYVEALRGKTEPLDYVLGFTATDFVNARGKRGKSTADYYLETLLGIDGAFVPTGSSGDRLALDLVNRLDDHPYLLFSYNPSAPPANLEAAETLLHQQYRPCAAVIDDPALSVQRYVDRAISCDRDYQPIHYEQGITIVDKFADFDREGETIRVVTGWEIADEATLELYNVSIQVITSDWSNVIQAPDRHLYHDVLKWYVVDLSTAELAPGDYRVVVIVYDRYQSSQKLSGQDLSSGEIGTILPILHFSIDE